MKALLEKIVNSGVKQGYEPWEIHLTRKLNSIMLIAASNMVVAIVFFEIIGYTQFVPDCLFALLASPLVLILNKVKNYVWGAYAFYVIGYLFLIPMNLMMGKDSFNILFFFPVIISLIMLLGRKEMVSHLIIISCLSLISIIAITIGYRIHFLDLNLGIEVNKILYMFNIILCAITTIAFSLVIVLESIAQETLIKKILREKEILLAEVFHRVKNNMNIITSLLNLKKNMSDSIEVKNALEDCRNRVFSMALVHENIFKSDNIIGLNFKEYIKNLISEIANSLGQEKKVEIFLDTDEVYLDLSSAIPCGLILNELITNSYKYAFTGTKKLEIQVKLKKSDAKIELEVRDNGPGISAEILKSRNTSGLEIIQSLSDQIDGVFSFTNNNGLIFNLQFSSK